MLSQLSIPCVGVRFQNKKRGNRQFEIAVCVPGEPVKLEHEPKNPADGNAIAVFSVRGIQMGYVSAERTALIHKAWRLKQEVRAVFQEPAEHGAWIRVAFNGEEPVLPPPRPASPKPVELPEGADPDSGFWPDEEWPEH